MTTTDQYLKRATRGLWGQKKREAVTELRGAIEDKIYRHRLCGLSEIEAERAALRDLGSPAAIARELGIVHTGPHVLRTTLLLGVVGVLGLHAAAQVPQVSASPGLVNCAFDERTLAGYTSDVQANLRAYVAHMGGIESAQAACLASPVTGENVMLKLDDLLAAVRAGGLEARTVPGSDAFVQLQLPGAAWQGLNLNLQAASRITPGGTREVFIDTQTLIAQLRFVFKGPLTLTGAVNPVLRLGPSAVQLGTAATPVRLSNLLLSPVLGEVGRQLWEAWPDPGELQNGAVTVLDRGDQPGHTRLRVGGADGTLYALVGTADGHLEQGVRASTGGVVTLPCACPPELVSTPRALYDMQLQKRTALLVFRVEAADLRHLTATLLPAAQVTLVTP